LLTPTERAVRELRVYDATEARCPGPLGYHDASCKIALLDVPPYKHDRNSANLADRVPDDDPRWPTHCASCPHVFNSSAIRQDHWCRLYQRSDNGELVPLADAEVGAMWFADWYSEHYKGPDGRCLVVKTPGGDWIVDGPSSNSRTPWTRSGEPPDITVSPSILFQGSHGRPDYHGWLRAGWLEEC
jgi:hypothetical protein